MIVRSFEAEERRTHLGASSTESPTDGCTAGKAGKLKIAFFGHFGQANFGNESTLRAILESLRRLAPDGEFSCICSGPESVTASHNINAVSSRVFAAEPQIIGGPLARWARRLLVGVPRELGQWLRGVKILRGKDALIVSGTGLLQDAYTLFSWGPYDMFRWSMSAKLCGCKLFFVSVGAGPLYTRAGRFFVKAALSLADFRSYRDQSTRLYLEKIGFRAANDPVYPDLAFSLPEGLIPGSHDNPGARPVVGLGLMKYAGRYSVETPTNAVYATYLATLVQLAEWLLAQGYDIRVLTGDVVDLPVGREFRSLLSERLATVDEDRVIDEPIESVEDLLMQLAATDLVVATRFHNVLLALLLNKPVIAISFHHKCTSLMEQMGLTEYCQDINQISLAGILERFSELQKSSDRVKGTIAEKVARSRDALDAQYAILLKKACSKK
jgi:polysaccharide pyruvyl transferase WcaK-like protein